MATASLLGLLPPSLLDTEGIQKDRQYNAQKEKKRLKDRE